MRQVLSDFEDRLLALAEDEFVHFKLARPVLGTFYGRNVSFEELEAACGRLTNLGLIRWRIHVGGKTCFRGSAPPSSQRNCSARFTASTLGKSKLAEPRHVA